MDAERWKRVELLLQEALDLQPDEHDAFLKRRCAGDEALERDVRALLRSAREAEGFLSQPAMAVAARGVARSEPDRRADERSGPVGQTVSHYRIVEQLGRGGMGVVYRAEDTRLGRPVALKFVSEELSHDREALDRFAREARTASALNHPNICTVHDIGEQDGRSFIVMEYLEGTTLRDRLATGPLSVNAVLDLGAQIADALDVAHNAGIIHRDIKPANIFIGARERVKVLDFGLAKMRASVTPDADTRISATRGMVVGTAAYMAPEQARGETVDHRADIWSFGVVLSEMVTGTQPAPGVRVRVDGSAELERIIEKCLEPDRELRYQHTSELRSDLERLRRGSSTTAAPQPAPARRKALWLSIGAAALIAAAIAWAIAGRRPATLTDKDTIVLGAFTNTTGDPVFDETLRQGLAVQLQQSPFLSIISDDRIRRTLPLMNQPADARLTPELARGVCVRTASAAVLEGSIAALGSQYVLGLRATDCTTGDVLADEQAQAARKEDVLNRLSEIATRFRTRVGESLATVEKHSRPLADATTSSLDALKAYSDALKEFAQSRRGALLERAVTLDPEFAAAHAQLGFNLGARGEAASGQQSLIKAYELRQRTSDLERFSIETFYDRDVTGNLGREQQTLEAWAQSYPRDPTPHTLLAGLALTSTGQHELAIAATEKATELDRDRTPAFANRAFNQLYLNRLDDALHTVALARERKLERGSLLLVPYFVAFLKGDDEEMKQTAAAARKIPELVDRMPNLETLALAHSGHLQDARRMSSTLVEIALQSDRREPAGMLEASRAVWEGFYGNAAAARQSAKKALTLNRGRNVDYAAAFALALSGDVSQARDLARDLSREFPEDTFVQFMYLPTLRALFALSANDAPAAIQALQVASRYDLHTAGVGYIDRFGALYPIYVRGLAYLASRQPTEAAGEFQRILDHRSIVLVDPMDAMARLHLARALLLSGDAAKAKTAYSDLLTLWKDADPDLQLLKETRAEFARLP